ncbi:XRE family transcriptional regulator [Streptomyces sp. Ru62]|uniref:XRE family transcriptional regulator n=1 Tax=Streptomyces sp. Ru62 TaxID=2080745 RepID=UPI000D1CDC56|nr:XRE family transcriptional regulator [Streptomyces sp. Ru62]
MDNPISLMAAHLRQLRLEAGEPSTREIAKMTGFAVSHTAVHQLLTGRKAGRWGPVEVIAEALGGDLAEVNRLWKKARQFENASKHSVDNRNEAPRSHYSPAGDRSHVWVRSYAAYEVAEALFQKGQKDEALSFLRSEMEKESGRYCSPLDMLYVQIQLSLPDPDSGLDDFVEARMGREVRDPHVAAFFADLYADSEDFSAAVRFGREAVRLDPENGLYHWRLALYISDLGADESEVLRHFRRAHKAAPNDNTYAASLMEALINEGLYSEAELIGRSFQPYPNVTRAYYWEVPYYLGISLALQGKLEEAAEALESEANEGNIFAVIERARVLHHSGNPAAALEQLSVELRTKNASHAANLEKLRILKAQNRHVDADKVIKELRQALVDPDAWDQW